MQIGPSGKAYLDAIRYSGIDTDVGYFDPTRAAPRLETGQEPPPPPKAPDGSTLETLSTARMVIIAVAAIILIGLAVLIFQNSGSFSLSLQGDAQNPVRQRRTAGSGPRAMAESPADLHTILTTADRRRALVMLAQAALVRTVSANGVLLQPSWTMRDALRHIPKAQTHLEALRSLVIAGESVLFGNRDVTEEEFQAQLTTIRPLLSEAAR